MINREILCGVASVVLGAIQYFAYFRGIFGKRIRPHVFTWLIWTLVTGIVFLVQVIKGGGAGAWATGFTASVCLAVFALSFSHGDKNLTALDWGSLFCALVALVLWKVTANPLHAVILVTIANTLGFVPTTRKSIDDPYGEPIIYYLLSNIKWIFSIVALRTFSWTTLLYPVTAVLSATVLIIFMLARRAQLKLATQQG